jgi:ribosomal protein S18 acetylase RimI-like enzyme
VPPIANIRPADAFDGPLLARMLVHAAAWRPDDRLTLEEALARPELAHYVEGWPRRDDRGVVAELIGHQGGLPTGTPVGAAWLRYLASDDPGYGYVDDLTPELMIGIDAPFRRRGVGHALLAALAADAQTAGIEQISLSVEHGNGAVELYRALGFTTVEDRVDGQTMVLSLVAAPERHPR